MYLKRVAIKSHRHTPNLVKLPEEDGEVLSFGRAPTTTVRLISLDSKICAGVSRKHAEIGKYKGQYYVKDLGSTNGVFVNGIRLESKLKVFFCPGDSICFGGGGSVKTGERKNVINEFTFDVLNEEETLATPSHSNGWKSKLESDSEFVPSTLSGLKHQTTKTKSSMGYRLTPRKSEVSKRHNELPLHMHYNVADSNTEKTTKDLQLLMQRTQENEALKVALKEKESEIEMLKQEMLKLRKEMERSKDVAVENIFLDNEESENEINRLVSNLKKTESAISRMLVLCNNAGKSAQQTDSSADPLQLVRECTKSAEKIKNVQKQTVSAVKTEIVKLMQKYGIKMPNKSYGVSGEFSPPCKEVFCALDAIDKVISGYVDRENKLRAKLYKKDETFQTALSCIELEFRQRIQSTEARTHMKITDLEKSHQRLKNKFLHTVSEHISGIKAKYQLNLSGIQTSLRLCTSDLQCLRTSICDDIGKPKTTHRWDRNVDKPEVELQNNISDLVVELQERSDCEKEEKRLLLRRLLGLDNKCRDMLNNASSKGQDIQVKSSHRKISEDNGSIDKAVSAISLSINEAQKRMNEKQSQLKVVTESCVRKIQQLEDCITCPICLDLFEATIVLPCSHSLCKGCWEQEKLRTKSKKGKSRKNLKEYECPQCRAKVLNDAREVRSVDQIVECFKKIQKESKEEFGNSDTTAIETMSFPKANGIDNQKQADSASSSSCVNAPTASSAASSSSSHPMKSAQPELLQPSANTEIIESSGEIRGTRRGKQKLKRKRNRTKYFTVQVKRESLADPLGLTLQRREKSIQLSVTYGGIAYKSGLRTMDIVSSVNKKEFDGSKKAYKEIIEEISSRLEVSITAGRSGEFSSDTDGIDIIDLSPNLSSASKKSVSRKKR